MAMPMRPWGHDFCPPSMAISGRGWASGRLLFTWPAISTQWRQISAILGPNHLTVGPETWGLKVAARRGFFRMDLVTPKSFFRKPLLAATFRPHISGSTVR